jgi:molecular chaperone DnaK (HSP70)
MKLGIDFGTNRTVVAAADRGNYPLATFEASDGSNSDWYPSLIAVRADERRYGWQAWEAQSDESWTVIRSIKRLLEDAGPGTILELGEQRLVLSHLLQGLARSLYEAIRENTNYSLPPEEPLQVILGVPAHANSNQRFLTVEAFRIAGFQVLGVLNEPSAASIEFGHKYRDNKTGRETILVYDLGGGTFDAALVALDDNVHHVIASEGIPTIGGDDFDHLLAEMALEAEGVSEEARDEITAAAWFRLLEECRIKKEALNPNTRKIVIDLEPVNSAWGSVTIQVSDYYELARPLVEETVAAAEDLLSKEEGEFEALYITGGGSELPLVARVLRERFGRRVRRSAYTRSATAIGLAIQADQPDTYKLSERLARFFGVWREADRGSKIVFDPLFAKGISLPPAGFPQLSIRRTYSPVHNIGHFRFLECSHCESDGTPTGEVALWDEIFFPFDPALQGNENLSATLVEYSAAASRERIQELYECDSSGAISVTISNCGNGFSRSYRLGRWSEKTKNVKPARRKTTKKVTAAVR